MMRFWAILLASLQLGDSTGTQQQDCEDSALMQRRAFGGIQDPRLSVMEVAPANTVTEVECRSNVRAVGGRFRDLVERKNNDFHYYAGMGSLGALPKRRIQRCQRGGCYNAVPDASASVRVTYEAPTGGNVGEVSIFYEDADAALTHNYKFGGTAGGDVFYQGDVCPRVPADRPAECWPGNPENVAGCTAANWDSRPNSYCFDLSAVNVVKFIFTNKGHGAGISLALKDASLTLDGTTHELGDIAQDTTFTDRCFYAPSLASASWRVDATLQYGPVSAECEAYANEQGQPVDELCGTTKLECSSIAAARGESVGRVCGGTESNQVTIESMQMTTLIPVVPACEESKPIPCDNPALSKFAAQAVNSDPENCATQGSDIKLLNVADGTFTGFCHVPDACLNACSVSPTTNEIFCQAFGFEGNAGHQQLVRVNCWKSVLNPEPVEASLCYYGKISTSTAASFDPDDGRYIFRSGSSIKSLTKDDLADFKGSADPMPEWYTQVSSKEVEIRSVTGIELMEDLVIQTVDLNNGQGETTYVVGCDGNKVQCVPISSNDPLVTLTMSGTDPAGTSGAQWAYGDSFYCAYNNGDDGVVQVDLTAVNNLQVPTGSVAAYPQTRSVDGFNCLLASSPFPPPTTRTTTTAGGHGDPHIQTLSGDHRKYLMAADGTFKLWHFHSGGEQDLKGFPHKVDWNVYAHYSRDIAMTEGLLFLDKVHHRNFEVVTSDCSLRTWEKNQWRDVLDDETFQEEGFVQENFDHKHQGVHVMRLAYEEEKVIRYRLRYFLLDGEEKTDVATWKVNCYLDRSHDLSECKARIDMKVIMYSQEHIGLVKGELKPHFKAYIDVNKIHEGSMKEKKEHWVQARHEKYFSKDEAFSTEKSWHKLGGSKKAEKHLIYAPWKGPTHKEVCGTKTDPHKNEAFLNGGNGMQDQCDQKAAEKVCSTAVPGEDDDDLAACIYDYCVGGEDLAKSHALYHED